MLVITKNSLVTLKWPGLSGAVPCFMVYFTVTGN